MARCRPASHPKYHFSEPIDADGKRHLKIIMSLLLQNLRPNDENYLTILHYRAETTETTNRETALKRKISVSTVRTTHTAPEADLVTMLVTTDNTDRITEENVTIQTLTSSKQILSSRTACNYDWRLLLCLNMF